MNNKYFIKLSNDWFYIKNKKSLIEQYGNNCFVIYVLLLRNLTLRNICIFSVNMIRDLIVKEKMNDSRQINIIKETLLSLHNNNIITIYNDYNCIDKYSNDEDSKYNFNKKNNSRLYYAKINDLPKDNFFILYDDEINKILDHCKSNNKNDIIKRGISIYNLLVYFGAVIKVINSKDKVGYFTYEVLYNKFGFSSDTVSKFNIILSDLKLIRYNNSFYDTINNRSLSNIYARFKDEEEFNSAVEERKTNINNGIIFKNKKDVQDLKRSLKQKLNAAWEKYKTTIFTEEKMKELQQLEYEYYKLICKDKTNKQLNKIGFQIINIDKIEQDRRNNIINNNDWSNFEYDNGQY